VLLLASGVPPAELAAELARRHFGGAPAAGSGVAGADARTGELVR